MDKHLVDFEKIEWVNGGAGVRYKAFIKGIQQLRLVEFSEGFTEIDWCLKGHAGYVLDGEFTIDFNGKRERFKKGDIVFIPKGATNRHKAILGKSEKVTLLLFEILEVDKNILMMA